MVYDAFEQGPIISTLAPDFELPDHNRKPHRLNDLIGAQGMLLGFIGDIWQPASVRRILWLQRHVSKFALLGTPVALMVRDHAHTLYGFHTSSPLPVPFPLLADVDGSVHQLYNMDKHAGLILIDRHRTIRQKWLMSPDYVWPKLTDLVQAAQQV
jgi:peroxiredoxin